MAHQNPIALKGRPNYIRNQEEHHRAKTFQEEYREFLAKQKIQYDERYVWD
jgi:putative transposase